MWLPLTNMAYSLIALIISMVKYVPTPELLNSEEETELQPEVGVKPDKRPGSGKYIVLGFRRPKF